MGIGTFIELTFGQIGTLFEPIRKWKIVIVKFARFGTII